MKVLVVNNYTMGDWNPVGYTMKNMLYGMPDTEFLQYVIDTNPNHEKMEPVITDKTSDSFVYRFQERKKQKSEEAIREENRRIKERMENAKKAIPEEKKEVVTEKPAAAQEKKQEEPAKKPVVELATATATGKMGEILRGCMYAYPGKINKENMQKIREFQPDVIYTLAENIRVINRAIKLSKKLGVPIVYHCMDDWKETAYTQSAPAKLIHKYLIRRFKRMHKFSVKNLAICGKMAKYYEETFKKPYTYAGNCILDFNEEPYKAEADKPLTIVYSGSLHFHRGNVLQDVAKVVEELNQMGLPAQLNIYAPSNHLYVFRNAFRAYPHTQLGTYGFPQRDKMECFKEADVFLHVESFDKRDIDFITYSFSTKLPEYYAVGRGVVAFGPKKLASISYVEETDSGWNAETLEELKEILVRLAKDPKERELYAEKTLKLAKEEFSQETMQNRIKGVMEYSIQEYGVKK